MVRAPDQEQDKNYKLKLHSFKSMHENAGRHTKSLSIGGASRVFECADDERVSSRSQGSNGTNDCATERQQPNGCPRSNVPAKSRFSKDESAGASQDMKLMRERFAKLLLGEDMSGGGKGVSSALALSNAITNLAASVFGEQRRVEPMPAERKARWRKEIEWLLAVTDYIVELVPSKQKSEDGVQMEIMVTRQRNDLHMNIPALRKLDAMLIDCLDNFKDQNEFTYISRDADDTEKGHVKRTDEKWWLPSVKVPPNGLSDMARKFLQYQKDCVNQVLKAAMAINAQVITEMEIPESYIESLPKNGKTSLGDSIYKSIKDDFFDPDQFLATMDLSSEHKILDLKNRIEASIEIWKRKMISKDTKSSWGSTVSLGTSVSLEERERFEDRAQTILLILKHRFPGIPQSTLDISKIQFNKDVGHAVLESYSRILESLAFTVMSRIEDVLYADFLTQNPSQTASKRSHKRDLPPQIPVSEKFEQSDTPNSKTLSDFMGWNMDPGESEQKKDLAEDALNKDVDGKQKLQKLVTNKRISYIEKLENLGGLRSPTARH